MVYLIRIRLMLAITLVLVATASMAEQVDSVPVIDQTIEAQAIEAKEKSKAIQELRDLIYPETEYIVTCEGDFTKEEGFKIDQIDVHDFTLLSEKEINTLISPYLNKCLSATSINDLVRSISNYYIELGYVTSRAYLKPQVIVDQQLDINVLEGRIENLRLNPNDAARNELATAFPDLAGTMLNLRDLEMGIEQMSRLPSNNPLLDLVPGSLPGQTQVVVNNTPENTFRPTIKVDNNGNESTGDIQVSAGLEWDNPLGFNDQLILSINGTQEQTSGRGARGNSGSWSVPYGRWIFDVSSLSYDYRQTIVGLNGSFLTEGESRTYGLGTKYIFQRDDRSKSKLGLSLTVKDSNNFIEDVLVTVSSYKLTVAKLSLSHLHFFKSGQWWLSTDATFGTDWLNAREDLSATGPQAQFEKYTMDVNLTKKLKLANTFPTWSSALHGQYSPDELFGTEQINVGNLYTVRGYDEENLSGSSGWHWRNELAFNRANDWMAQSIINSLSVYVAYDVGGIHRDSQGANLAGRLSGAALGFRLRGPHVSLDLSFAHPVDAAEGFREDAVTSINLLASF